MSELLDAILKDLKEVAGARGLKLVVSREILLQLKREAQILDDAPALTCFGIPFEESTEIEGWEIHQEIPKNTA